MAALIVSGACSSEPLSPEGPAPVKSVEEFPAAYAAGVCDAIARCCAGQRFDFDPTACRESISQRLQQLIDESAGLDFDPVAADACIQENSSIICPQEPMESYGATPSCTLAFQGRLKPGEPCRVDAECRDEPPRLAFCDVEQGCVLESLPARGAAGDPCSGTCFESEADGTDCFELFLGGLSDVGSVTACYIYDGLQCSDLTQTCEELLAIGKDCVLSDECQTGAFCSFETGKCEARRSSGPCVDELDACDAMSTCDLEADQCVPRRQADGTRCSSDRDCDSYYCNPYSVCQPGVTSEECSGAFD